MISPTIPPHAARLWLEDDSIHLDLPAVGSFHSHRLTFPNNAPGLARLLHLIQQRSHESKIGTDGDLTQAQLDNQLKRDIKAKLRKQGFEALEELNLQPGGINMVKRVMKDTFTESARASARDVLRRLGLT